MKDNTILNRYLEAGAGRREVKLRTEEIHIEKLPPAHALVRNHTTLIYPGADLALLWASEKDGRPRRLGRLAIGRVEREAAEGPRRGEWIYWNGPHGDWGELDPKRHLWASVAAPDPLVLPAGIGAEAEFGLRAALGKAAVPSHCAVLGQGMLGHLAAQWLKLQGASATVIENSPKRLEFSKYSGLRQKIDTHNVDWMERLRKWNVDGVDLLVDACGYVQPLLEVLPILKPGGTLCSLGPWRQNPTDELLKRLKETGVRLAGPGPCFGEAPAHGSLLNEWIHLIADKKILTERLLTNTSPPDEGRMDVKRLAAGVKSICGVVIQWTGEGPKEE